MEHDIASLVYAAKEDMRKADELIGIYMPFLRSEASKFMARICTEQDDELSIAMIAFHEAIRGYTRERGGFLKYAAMLIRSRLIDYQRREKRHRAHSSLNEDSGEDGISLADRIADPRDGIDESVGLAAAQQEIAEFCAALSAYGVQLTDIAENSPRQKRTLDACLKAVRHAVANPSLLDELVKSKKLPLAQLVAGTGVERKTLERHRKYILAMLLIQTNGFELIRGHLQHVIGRG